MDISRETACFLLKQYSDIIGDDFTVLFKGSVIALIQAHKVSDPLVVRVCLDPSRAGDQRLLPFYVHVREDGPLTDDRKMTLVASARAWDRAFSPEQPVHAQADT